MPRTRTPDRAKLPKYVYRTRGWYVYRAYLGSNGGRAQFAPDQKLCRDDEALTEVWRAYHEATQQKRNTLAWLVGEYLVSDRYAALSRPSQDAYQRNARVVTTTKLKGGKPFGDVSMDSLTPGVFRRYMDKRSRAAPVQANRELSFLKAAFAWALERDIVSTNPVKPVRKNKENARERYINDWEYQLVYDLAPRTMRCAMELAYLCRARKSELRSLRRSHCVEDGLLLERGKGSKTQIILWTPRLQTAVSLGSADSKVTMLDPYLLNKDSGGPITNSSFNSAWQRTMRKAMEQGLPERFTFHDIKAKGVSDFDGDKARASGHKSARMTAIYDRKLETIDATK